MIEGLDRRVVVVGGGPIGLYTAYLIKKLNPMINVLVLEEHSEIGLPICCSGLIDIYGFNKTKLKDYISINDCVVNKVKGADIFGPHNARLKINARNYKAYVINREKFDKKIMYLALSIGVEIDYNKKVIDVYNDYVVVKDLTTSVSSDLRYDFLVGADGPNSIVRTSIVTDKLETDFIHVYQIDVEGNFDCDRVQMYLGDFAKGLFGWVIPETPFRAKIGIGTYVGKSNPKDLLIKFKDKFNIKYDKETYNCSGILPISKPLKKYAKNNRLVVGDAACFVKATTGGGINFGLLSAEAAAKSINLRIKEFKSIEKTYPAFLAKHLSELKLHYKIRNYLLSKNNVELDVLLNKLKVLGIEKLLEERGNMDYPSFFVSKMLLNPKYLSLFPELIKFMRS